MIKLDWRAGVRDGRDYPHDLVVGIALNSVEEVDLRPKMPPVYNQLALSSCSDNAAGAAYEFDLIKQGLTNFKPSRLFLYYNTRSIEGTVSSDCGATIRDTMWSLNRFGVCQEKNWDYLNENLFLKPSEVAYTEASSHKSIIYGAVPKDLSTIKQVLSSGFPVVFGLQITDYFEGDEARKTGVIKLPDHNSNLLGGHALLISGYDDKKGWFIVRNSWGDSYGDKGYNYIPYDYIVSDFSADFWVLRSVS